MSNNNNNNNNSSTHDSVYGAVITVIMRVYLCTMVSVSVTLFFNDDDDADDTTTITNNNNNNNNILHVAKCTTGRKCRSGCIGDKVDEVQYALRLSHVFFISWSLVRRSSQPRSRNRQKSHALHSRSTGNYVPVPTYFHGNSAFQQSVPCHHVHSFRVPILTVADIHFCIC